MERTAPRRTPYRRPETARQSRVSAPRPTAGPDSRPLASLVRIDLELDAAGHHVIVITEYAEVQRVVAGVQFGCWNVELRRGFARQSIDLLRCLRSFLYRERGQRRRLIELQREGTGRLRQHTAVGRRCLQQVRVRIHDACGRQRTCPE